MPNYEDWAVPEPVAQPRAKTTVTALQAAPTRPTKAQRLAAEQAAYDQNLVNYGSVRNFYNINGYQNAKRMTSPVWRGFVNFSGVTLLIVVILAFLIALV
jgi:hypothetical protein